MVPLKQEVDISPVAKAVSRAGTSIVGSDYHTGGFLWLADPDRAATTSLYLDQAKMPAVSAVYYRGEAGGRPRFLPSPATASSIAPATLAAHRYLLETLNGTNAPHVVLIYPELTGTLGVGGSAQKPWHGDHGGASWQSHHVPLIVSGAGIRKGHQSRFPARLVDLAPTFLRLLGVPYPMLDGVVLADAIGRPIRGEVAAQRVAGGMLVPIAAALKRQSILDVNHIGVSGGLNPPPAATSRGFAGVGVY
jgi:hypothetical protein